MKWTMKLRTRMFLSISALITVALLGLFLGLVSVVQMASVQERLLSDTRHVLELGVKLRQNLGEQLSQILDESPNRESLGDLQTQFQQLVDQGLQEGGERSGLEQIRSSYLSFIEAYRQSTTPSREMGLEQPLGMAFDGVRRSLIASSNKALDEIDRSEERNHDQAWLVGGVLGLMGLAVLVLGFITAHSIARRFGLPIEALARAADQVGRGNFDVTLPIAQGSEMHQLTRRFGLMADALRKHQATNIDELLAGQQRLQAVLDSIDDGLLIIDPQGCLAHLNPVAQRQLGWDSSRIGTPLEEALERPELQQQLRQVLRGGNLDRPPDDLSFEVDEDTRLLSYSLTPVSHPQGPILGAVMVLRDVTEQRAFERVRSEFVLRASHELRTPITGMHMAFGLFRERIKFPANTRESDLLDTIGEEMQRLTQLINDLLNFSRYQNGLQKLDVAPCDVETLLARAHERFAASASEKRIELVIDMELPLPRIQADVGQLDRVLDNLLHNAIRHTPSDGHIRLHARRHAERVIISVEDSGEGIAYGQQGRIFEPFVQVGRKKGGAGLGLALCKEIVQLHGGRMGVFSRPGQGTQFYMALPV
ncbi:KinB sensor domain-containing domain [Pseudomonas sp. UBA6562]|uniref:KinB sensor domain-containing domain n=1 Tax=Pseudomonas sp. UBA6562 TaxID=1947332 RepID=UPI0025E2F271|nr:KinB sensor domain-containing domain [Pseudomonas sp. UBA6562]